mgnify:CR=1 FL=1
MKSFKEFSKEITETTHVSVHRRTPTEMAILHKNILINNGHTILSHETPSNGSHIIHHLTPKNRVRVSTIKSINSGSNKSEIEDRLSTPEEQEKFGPKE